MKAVITEKQEDLDRIQQFVKNGNLKAVKNWIEKGKPVFCTKGNKYSPLENSIRYKRRTIFKQLLELDFSASPQALTKCLNYALRLKNLSYIKQLVAKGADVESLDWDRIIHSNTSILRFFLGQGKDIAVDRDQSIFNSTRDIRDIKLILEYQSKYPSMEYLLFRYAVHVMFWQRDIDFLRKIIKGTNLDVRKKYKDISNKNDNGESLLEAAFKYANLPVVKLLRFSVEKDDINSLMRGSWYIKRDIVEYALNLGLKETVISHLLLKCIHNYCFYKQFYSSVSKIREIDESDIHTAEWLIGLGGKLTLENKHAIASLRKLFCDMSEYSIFSFAKTLLTTTSPEVVVKIFDSIPLQRHLGRHLPEIKRRLRIKKSIGTRTGTKGKKSMHKLEEQTESTSYQHRRTQDSTETSRIELYNEVWSIPISKLSHKYGISDVGLAKICKKHNIPRPPRGYWARIKAGHKDKKTPIPQKDDNRIIYITPYAYNKPLKLTLPEKKQSNARDSKPVAATRQKTIFVPERLSKVHPLVKSTSYEMRIAKIEDNRLVPFNKCLPICVSKKALRRSLLIFDTILKEFAKRGYDANWSYIWGRYDSSERFGVKVFDHFFGIKLEEVNDRKVPKLSLELYQEYKNETISWSDSTDAPIEDVLDDFFDRLFASATEARDAQLEAERVAKETEEAKQKAEQVELEKQENIKRFKELQQQKRKQLRRLCDDSDAWFKSQRIRQYIEAVKETRTSPGVPVSPELLAWIEESQKFADRIDPFTDTPPSIIDLDMDNDIFYQPWDDIEKIINAELLKKRQ